MSRKARAGTLLLVIAALAGARNEAAAQTDLPIGTTASATATERAPAVFRFVARAAGVLIVVVRGNGDLTLAVTDEDGQSLPDGSADRDLGGDLGSEMIAVLIPHAGEYRVAVRLQSGGSASTLQVSANWLAFPAFARPEDPDGRPGQARPLEVGQPHEDQLDSAAGDDRDWFVIRAPAAGSLVVVTRLVPGDEGDLVLEAFTGGDFTESAAHSDQDLQGDTGNESVTVNVNAGDIVHIKVSSAVSSTPRVRYRISSSVIP